MYTISKKIRLLIVGMELLVEIFYRLPYRKLQKEAQQNTQLVLELHLLIKIVIEYLYGFILTKVIMDQMDGGQ